MITITSGQQYGLSSLRLLVHIIPVQDYFNLDILKKTTDGSFGEDANESSRRILPDGCSFLIDYPGASQVIDVMIYSVGSLAHFGLLGTEVPMECLISHTHQM